MKKFYVIVPIILLGIFIVFFLIAKDDIRRKEIDKQVQIEKEREDRRREAEEARKRAYEIAAEQARVRLAEIEAKRIEDERQLQIRQDATDARELAHVKKLELSDQVRVHEGTLRTFKGQKAEVEKLIKLQTTQVDYLKAATKEVALNKDHFVKVLQKITDAEKAFEAAERARRAEAAANRRAGAAE